MKKVNKSRLTTIAIIIAIIIISFFSLRPSKPILTDEETIKCIGEKSTLYVQLGCSHCEDQEELFGENLKYINRIDCFYETEKCADIKGTPTWDINGKKTTGVLSIETLKQLTKC